MHVERGRGWVNRSTSFDQIAVYDLKKWVVEDQGFQLTLEKGSLSLRYTDKSASKTFAKELERLRKDQLAFEDSLLSK